MMVAPRLVCPKHMVHGPCGGVRADGACEMLAVPCPFDELVPWALPPAEPAELPEWLPDQRPWVITDLRVEPYDRRSVRDVVATLAPSCDAVLVGEHQDRPDLPPTLLAAEVLEAGGRPLTTLTCRDRNRLVLEQELVGLATVGAEVVLCVTGDGRGQGVRPDVTQVFDLDGTRLAALARATGLVPAVPEAPEARPQGLRPSRVLEKERAGARFCVLNHASSPARVAEFVTAARRAGATLPFVASVALYTDEMSARVLQAFPGLFLDDRTVHRVLSAPDPEAAGIAVAVDEARALLAIPGIVGVNLSGKASSRSVQAGAEIKAAVGHQVRG